MPLAYGLIEGIDLSLPDLPAGLVGARITHLSDLHVRSWHRRGRIDRLASQLAAIRFDLLVLSGDYMTRPGDESAAIDALRRILERVQPRWGVVGVFGNHDTDAFRAEVRSLPVHWLADEVAVFDAVGLEVWGLGWLADAVALARAGARVTDPARFRLGLSHTPTTLPTLSDLGVRLMLSGHTHGGQIRLPTGHALKNSIDWPLHLTSGVFRHRDTLAAVSRGVGEMTLPLRLWCPRHIPMYILRRGAMPGQHTDTILCVRHW